MTTCKKKEKEEEKEEEEEEEEEEESGWPQQVKSSGEEEVGMLKKEMIVPSERRANILLSGPLFKRTKLGRWVLRHHRLDENRRLLYYSKRRGRMVFVATVDEARPLTRYGTPTPYVLRLSNSFRRGSILVCAETAADFRDWQRHCQLREAPCEFPEKEFLNEKKNQEKIERQARRKTTTRRRVARTATLDVVVLTTLLFVLALASASKSRLALVVGSCVVAMRVFLIGGRRPPEKTSPGGHATRQQTTQQRGLTSPRSSWATSFTTSRSTAPTTDSLLGDHQNYYC